MRRSHDRARLLVAALTVLLTSALAGRAGFVLCLGADGHRALEFEHPGIECPTLTNSSGTSASSLEPAAQCRDLPTNGMRALSSADSDRVPMPPVAFLPARLEPAPGIEARLPDSTDTRAGPSRLALHLRSTVLLV